MSWYHLAATIVGGWLIGFAMALYFLNRSLIRTSRTLVENNRQLRKDLIEAEAAHFNVLMGYKDMRRAAKEGAAKLRALGEKGFEEELTELLGREEP